MLRSFALDLTQQYSVVILAKGCSYSQHMAFCLVALFLSTNSVFN